MDDSFTSDLKFDDASSNSRVSDSSSGVAKRELSGLVRSDGGTKLFLELLLLDPGFAFVFSSLTDFSLVIGSEVLLRSIDFLAATESIDFLTAEDEESIDFLTVVESVDICSVVVVVVP